MVKWVWIGSKNNDEKIRAKSFAGYTITVRRAMAGCDAVTIQPLQKQYSYPHLSFQYHYVSYIWLSSTNACHTSDFPVPMRVIHLTFQYQCVSYIWLFSTNVCHTSDFSVPMRVIHLTVFKSFLKVSFSISFFPVLLDVINLVASKVPVPPKLSFVWRICRVITCICIQIYSCFI